MKFFIILGSIYIIANLALSISVAVYEYKIEIERKKYKQERRIDLQKILTAFNVWHKSHEEAKNEIENFMRKYDYTSYEIASYISGDYDKDEIGYPVIEIDFYKGHKIKLCLNVTERKYYTSKGKKHKL